MTLRVHTAIAVILIVVFMPSAIRAQQRHDCEWLLDKGIYDTESVMLDRHTFDLLKSLLKHSKAGSIKEFEEEIKGIGIGLPIPKLGVLGIKFNNKDARTSFKEWREGFLNTSHHELKKDVKLRIEINKISPTLMEAVKHCLDNRPKGEVVAWLTPSKNALVWTLHAKYSPRGPNDDCVIMTFSVTPAPGSGEIKIPNKDQARLFSKDWKIDAERNLELTRNSTNDGAVISINTTRGAVRLEIPGNIPPDPIQMIADLHTRLKDLEDEVNNLQRRTPALGANIKLAEHENVPNVGYVRDGHAIGLPLPRACRGHEWIMPDKYGKRVLAVWHVVTDGKATGEPFRIRNVIKGNRVHVYFDAPDVPVSGIRVVWRILYEE